MTDNDDIECHPRIDEIYAVADELAATGLLTMVIIEMIHGYLRLTPAEGYAYPSEPQVSGLLRLLTLSLTDNYWEEGTICDCNWEFDFHRTADHASHSAKWQVYFEAYEVE